MNVGLSKRWNTWTPRLVMFVVCLMTTVAWADLQGKVQVILQSMDLRQTEMSLIAIDLTDQKKLLSINPDTALIPASNMKLVTTAAALDYLGPEHVFRTTLNLVEDDTADADASKETRPSILVVGDGDPAFGDPGLLADHGLTVEQVLEQWVAAIKKTGHQHFGTLYVDDRVFDRDFVHESWPKKQLNRWYCAQVAGINFHTNCLDVLPSPSRYRGAAPAVEIQPHVSFIQTENRARTGPDDTFWISRRLNSNQITFHGIVKHARSKPVHVTFHDPPIFFGKLLRERLTAQGIRVGDVKRVSESQTFSDIRPLHVFQTTMPLILARVNQDSQNMYAEALFKRVGYEATGAPGSWINGAAAIRQMLRQRLGASAVAVHVADGSGLSRNNRIASRHIAALLESMYRDTELWPLYRSSLAKAGETGSLEDRLEDVPCDVYGKTGFINAVSSLSGYVLVPDPINPDLAPERVIVFSLLFNDYRPPISTSHIRRLQNRIVRELAEYAVEQSTQPAP